MPRLFTQLFFLMLISESVAMFNGAWSTPLSLIYTYFVTTLPIKMSVFEIACIYLAWRAPNKAADRLVARGPLPKAIKVSMATCVVWTIYGMVTGGLIKPVNQQLHAYVFGLVMALNASAVLRTAADFQRLGRMIVYAAWWRAAMGFIFYIFIVPSIPQDKYPPYMTTHDDTMLSVLALVILIANATQTRTRAAVRYAFLGGFYLLATIQLNNRRLAWASLAACLIMVYVMLPKNKVKQRIKRSLLMLSPVIAIYVTVGWGRPEPIFKPIRSFSSMGAGKIDASTLARDNENYSMLRMINERPFQGYGWGQEWIEFDSSYGVRLDQFPLYHYIPHNSVLALYTFTGMIGFGLTWIPLFVGSFLNARVYRLARNPLERAAGISGLAGIVIYMNQLWGDMGIYSGMGGYIMGVSLAVGGRLSIMTGAWPGLKPPSPTPQKSAPRPAVGAQTREPRVAR